MGCKSSQYFSWLRVFDLDLGDFVLCFRNALVIGIQVEFFGFMSYQWWFSRVF